MARELRQIEILREIDPILYYVTARDENSSA